MLRRGLGSARSASALQSLDVAGRLEQLRSPPDRKQGDVVIKALPMAELLQRGLDCMDGACGAAGRRHRLAQAIDIEATPVPDHLGDAVRVSDKVPADG